MQARRFSSIGSPLLNSIRAANCRPLWMESLRTLTPQETAILSEVSPRGFPEVSILRCGFAATVTGLGFRATSADLVVRTIYSGLAGTRHSHGLIEYSTLSVSRLSQFRALLGQKVPTDRATGEIAPMGARLFRVSTLLAIIQPEVIRRQGRSFAGLQVNPSSEPSADFQAMNLFGGLTLE